MIRMRIIVKRDRSCGCVKYIQLKSIDTSTQRRYQERERERRLGAVPHSRSVATTDYDSLTIVSHKNHYSSYRTLGMKRPTKFEACLPSYVDVG